MVSFDFCFKSRSLNLFGKCARCRCYYKLTICLLQIYQYFLATLRFLPFCLLQAARLIWSSLLQAAYHYYSNQLRFSYLCSSSLLCQQSVKRFCGKQLSDKRQNVGLTIQVVHLLSPWLFNYLCNQYGRWLVITIYPDLICAPFICNYQVTNKGTKFFLVKRFFYNVLFQHFFSSTSSWSM